MDKRKELAKHILYQQQWKVEKGDIRRNLMTKRDAEIQVTWAGNRTLESSRLSAMGLRNYQEMYALK